MTSPVEAAEGAALGRIDRAEPLLLVVRLANEPNRLARTHAASQCDGFRDAVMSAAGGANQVEQCRLAAQDTEALATEMTGAAP